MTVMRPMLWISFAFVAGMYLLALFGATVTYTVIFCVAIICFVQMIRKRNTYENVLLIFIYLSFLFGIIRYGICDDITLKSTYPFLEQEVIITGSVTENAKVEEEHISLTIDAKEIVLGDEKNIVSDKITLTCFIDKDNPTQNLIPGRGDDISIRAKLSRPNDTMNKGGFSYAEYLKTKRIYFQAVGEISSLRVISHENHPFTDWIFAFREKCATLFDNTFPANESSILKAYILGDTSGMLQEITEIFSVSGLSHVLAVSGMHVVVLIAAVTFFFRKMHMPQRWQLGLMLFIVPLYVIFTGMSVSALRAGFVCVTSILAKLFFKRSDPLTALFEAAAFLCLCNPMVIMSASFMLSFAATLGILLFSEPVCTKTSIFYDRFKKYPLLRKIVSVGCDVFAIGVCAQVFTIPVLLYLFQSFSTTSIVSTVLLTPILSPLLAGGLLFCIAGNIHSILAFPFAGFIFLLAKFLLYIVRIFAAIPFSSISYGVIKPFYLLCYALFVFVLYAIWAKKKMHYRISIFSLALLSVVFFIYSISHNSILTLSFINVGQGDCALIQAPGNCDIIIDGGGSEGDYSVAENILQPYLLKQGVNEIEYAVASHGHADHINGIIGLLDLMKVNNLIISSGFGNTENAKALIQKAVEKNTTIITMSHGDKIKMDNGLTLTAIMPDEKILYIPSNDDENNRSLLLKVEYGENAILFTGDLLEEGEAYTAKMYGEMLDADILKLAHHGSSSANSPEFLDAVTPSYVYIPVGKNNYGQPNISVLRRLHERKITYYRADIDKDITFYMNKERICGVQ